MQYDVIIVGAGMAGMTAGIYVARAGKSVLVLESKVFGGQIVESLTVSNWPGEKKISGADLMKNIHKQAENLGAKFAYESVEKISGNVGEFTVKTDEGEYSCKAVIIATGTEPRKLNAKQKEEAGKRPISYCATCDGALYAGKPVVVIGSGNTAKYEAAYLKNIASEVYQIHHDDPIPKEAEAIFVAIGRIPTTEFLKGFVELDKDGYVVADENCETSRPGVFVAGDCRSKTVRQLVTAAGDGAVAATRAVQYLG